MKGQLRSQGTRDRILAEARRLFAEQGFERTTIRAIAAAAEINPSMVIRYYGTKEDLFATAATIDFRMPDLAAIAPSRRGVALIEHVLDRWDAGDELPALLRAAGSHERAQQRLAALVQEQALPVIRGIVPEEGAAERVAMIAMTIAGLVVSRYIVRLPVVNAMDRDAQIHHAGAIVQHYLTPRPTRKPR